MNLELSLKQTLKLSPQMLQSMEILQMSTLELGEFIQELVQENPAAELAEPPDPGDESCGGACSPWRIWTTRTGSTSPPTGMSWTPWPGWERTGGWPTPCCSI